MNLSYNQSEEAFLLTCVNEVIKVWSSHGQATMYISVNEGQAVLHLGFQLGAPRDPHQLNAPVRQSPPRRYKSQAKREKDNSRAAAHQVKLRQTVISDSSTLDSPISPTSTSASLSFPATVSVVYQSDAHAAVPAVTAFFTTTTIAPTLSTST